MNRSETDQKPIRNRFKQGADRGQRGGREGEGSSPFRGFPPKGATARGSEETKKTTYNVGEKTEHIGDGIAGQETMKKHPLLSRAGDATKKNLKIKECLLSAPNDKIFTI